MLQTLWLNEAAANCAIEILIRKFLIKNSGARLLGNSEKCTQLPYNIERGGGGSKIFRLFVERGRWKFGNHWCRQLQTFNKTQIHKETNNM